MTIFVEEWIKDEFARLADVRRRSPSNEAELLLETEIKEAYKSGELDRPQENNTSESSKQKPEMDAVILRKKIRGEKLSPKERTYLSRIGFTTGEINRFDKPKNGNGEPKDDTTPTRA